MERYAPITGTRIVLRAILSVGVLLMLAFFRCGRDIMHRLQMRTGSGGGGMGRWMLAAVIAMMPGRQVPDFGVIGMIERFEDELSPVTASGLDGISDGGMGR